MTAGAESYKEPTIETIQADVVDIIMIVEGQTGVQSMAQHPG